MKITQVLCAAGPVDAVTNQGLACRRLFSGWGWEGSDYAAVVAPGVRRRTMRSLRELRPADGELLLLHYSGFVPGLERLFTGPQRRMLISHNITPARYFWAHEPLEAVRCELAVGQLAEIASKADALAGVSDYNAHELEAVTARKAEVIPVLFDRHRLGSAAGPPEGPPKILFVGRLVPHKRQDLVIRAFAEYRRRETGARLVLVGTPLSPAYAAHLHALAEELAPGAVSFETAISPSRLAEHYRSAHAFLCLSEHEGFCIPLLEAFHFGVPVIARATGAVPEVVDEAGVLLGEHDDAITVAELLSIVVGDQELRAELRKRAEQRLAVYDYRRTANRLRDAMMRLAAA